MQLTERVRQAVEQPINKVDRINLLNLFEEVFLLKKDANCPSCVISSYHELRAWLQTKNGIDMEAKINLISCEYVSEDFERNQELKYCVARNKESGLFNEIILLKHQPTFNELFEITKRFPNDINVIANTDIFFDETIKQARAIFEREAYALTRWDYKGGNQFEFFNRPDSQDVWVIKGAVKNELKADFKMGVAGCDNRLAYELKQAGYIVRNPSLTIRCYHYHLSGKHTYNPNVKVPEPYQFVNPHSL